MHTLVPAAVTASFSDGLGATIVLLAAFGIYSLWHMENNKWRIVTLLVLIGILVVNIAPLHQLGSSLRSTFNEVAVSHGKPELVGDFVFSIVVLAFIAVSVAMHRRKKDDGNGWMIAAVIGSVVFFTVGWASDLIITIAHYAAMVLPWVQSLNF